MNNQNHWKTFIAFALRGIIAHTATYFIFGAFLSGALDDAAIFQREIIRDSMLPIHQHNVLMGPFRSFLLESSRGWVILWGLLVTIGILSASSGSSMPSFHGCIKRSFLDHRSAQRRSCWDVSRLRSSPSA